MATNFRISESDLQRVNVVVDTNAMKIRVLVNDHVKKVDELDPNMTVIQFTEYVNKLKEGLHDED